MKGVDVLSLLFSSRHFTYLIVRDTRARAYTYTHTWDTHGQLKFTVEKKLSIDGRTDLGEGLTRGNGWLS